MSQLEFFAGIERDVDIVTWTVDDLNETIVVTENQPIAMAVLRRDQPVIRMPVAGPSVGNRKIARIEVRIRYVRDDTAPADTEDR